MGSVYRVGSVYGTTYHNTAKEADRQRPGGEQPESVDRLDAAGECSLLFAEAVRQEERYFAARLMLQDVCDCFLAEDDEDRRTMEAALKFLRDNPAPAADSAERDGGGRSYGI